MINVIRFKENLSPKKFQGQLISYEILIDRKNLKELIVYAAKEKGFSWQEAKETVVCLEQLHKSISQTGEYLILVSSSCLMNGVEDSLDVGLSPIKTQVSSNEIEWEFKILGEDSKIAELKFIFHRPQIIQAINELPKKTLNK